MCVYMYVYMYVPMHVFLTRGEVSDARRYPAVSSSVQTGKSSSSVDRSAEVSDARRYQTRGEVSDARRGIRRAEVSDARRYPAGDV